MAVAALGNGKVNSVTNIKVISGIRFALQNGRLVIQ
jgi:hypothetical protein